MAREGYYDRGHHEAASKFPAPIHPRKHLWRTKPIKKLLLVVLLIALQTKSAPKNMTARVDNCAPIGRTANGMLVYSMKCENLPAPPAPPPQAEVAPPSAPTAAPEPEIQRSGIFGWSYERKRPGQ